MERYGGSAGVPLYTDESPPVPKSHIRTSPASPQWQRKLELPLRIVLACINATDHTATTRLTVLWKTLTIMKIRQMMISMRTASHGPDFSTCRRMTSSLGSWKW